MRTLLYKKVVVISFSRCYPWLSAIIVVRFAVSSTDCQIDGVWQQTTKYRNLLLEDRINEPLCFILFLDFSWCYYCVWICAHYMSLTVKKIRIRFDCTKSFSNKGKRQTACTLVSTLQTHEFSYPDCVFVVK